MRTHLARSPLVDRDPRPGNLALAVTLAQTVLPAWLLVSTVLWPPPPAAYYSTWIAGLAASMCGAALLRAPWLQYVSAALGAWLILAATGLPQSTLAAWQSGLIGAVLLGLSFVPIHGEHHGLGPSRRRPAQPLPRETSLAMPTELLDSPPALQPPVHA